MKPLSFAHICICSSDLQMSQACEGGRHAMWCEMYLRVFKIQQQ